MGTLPLSFEQESPPSSFLIFIQSAETWHLSQKSNPSTPWWLNTLLRPNGLSLATLSPRPLDSPWPRPLLVPLNSTTNIAVSMLVMRILTLTSLMSLILLSVNTMASLLTSHTSLTWTLPKLPEMLNPMFPFTLAESVSDVPSKDSVSPLASPSNNVSMLRL